MTRKTYSFWVVTIRLLAEGPLLAMVVLMHAAMGGHGGAAQVVENALLYTAFAGLHSLLARDPAKRIAARIVGPDRVRVAYVMFSGVTLALVLLCWQPVSGDLWHAHGLIFWLLTGAYGLAILALLRVTTYFDYTGFLGLHEIAGAHTDQPAIPPTLSVRGPYAYCRHPMYFALLAIFWIGPVMSWGRFEFVLLGTLYLFVGTRFEERNLRRELGAAYDLYCAHVPMWIPRRTPWHSPES